MDMDQEAEELLARIRTVREALEAGRLTSAQIQLYRQLGRDVERITQEMDAAPDAETADLLWASGARQIREFLDLHFTALTRH